MTQLEQLEKRAEVELARLGVAENLGLYMAILIAMVAHWRWDNWLLTLLVVFCGYFVLTYPYRKSESAAEDAYHRAAGIGKYLCLPKSQDAP